MTKTHLASYSVEFGSFGTNPLVYTLQISLLTTVCSVFYFKLVFAYLLALMSAYFAVSVYSTTAILKFYSTNFRQNLFKDISGNPTCNLVC